KHPSWRGRVARARATLFLFLLGICVSLAACHGDTGIHVPYSTLKQLIARGDVKDVHFSAIELRAEPTEAARRAGAPSLWLATPVPDGELVRLLDAHGVTYEGIQEDADPPLTLIVSIGLIGAVVLLIVLRSQKLNPARGIVDLVRSRSRVRDRRAKSTTSFNDVAGVDEARSELEDVVKFLREPAKFVALGARVPKGVLLVGPPGTGKTLLARAVAGEAGVPFFSVSGSEFVEMYVGVGAARVRKLFAQAKAKAPAIVFIDEMDAVGKSRSGSSGVGGVDEREHTLNQLLVEMDGFDARHGLIVMGATNRAEILDAALLRPGRFDRRVLVDRPDGNGRQAILNVHARKLKLNEDVDLAQVARRTPGFVGADLENVLNEAALLAARGDKLTVGMSDVDAAIDRVVVGLERKNRLVSEKERRIVAYHEAGHAIVAEMAPTAEPVHKVSIVPRGLAGLGYMQQTPDDRQLLQQDELLDRLAVLLGGRAAEQLTFGQFSTGASNDLERATDIARRMVCEFGMAAGIGPVAFVRPQGRRTSDNEPAAASEQVNSQIEAEIHALL
ncbi:MAG TPA: ATP-dependent zinc metalloprotease FtsH, partial [Polyangiaceae bacterium]